MPNNGLQMAAKSKDAKKKCPTALKRLKQNHKQNLLNRSFKSRVRTAIRSFETAVTTGQKEGIQVALNTVYSLVDKAAKTGIYKRNKAARVKSRIAHLEKQSA